MSFPDELVIPGKRWRLLCSSGGYSLLALGSAGASVTSLARGEMLYGLGLGLLAVCAGYFARGEVRKLLSRGLVLNANGFEFDGRQWCWSEISRIAASVQESTFNYSRTIIELTMRPEYAKRENPVQTPIDVANFMTGGEPLESIMRRWQKRYGTPTRQSAPSPRMNPEIRGRE
jgi:hypothetical protein